MYIPLTPKQCLLCEEEFLCKNTRVKVPICNICVADNVDHSEVTLMRYTEIYAENVKDGNSAFAMIDFLNRLDDYEKMLAYKFLWIKNKTNREPWWGIGEDKNE